MASETYDYDPFDNTEHSMKQIADAIRHKGYGKDVREAIAQGIGQFDQVKGDVFKRIAALKEDNSALNQRVDELGERIAALEDMLFGKRPQEVKMSENSTPPVNSGVMLVNLTNKEDK